MLLERLLVEILNETRQEIGNYPTRDEFLAYIERKKWPRWNYPFYSKDKFHNFINDVLGDCIEGEYGYIAHQEDRQRLAVTAKGRKFIAILNGGFIEEFRSRRKRTTDMILAIVLSGSFGALVAHFWPLIIKIYEQKLLP